jgi:hypothetical protein
LPGAFRRYLLAGVADRIAAPALVLDAENDQFLKGEPAGVQTDRPARPRL